MGVETLEDDESLYSILTMINNGTWQIIQRFPLHIPTQTVAKCHFISQNEVNMANEPLKVQQPLQESSSELERSSEFFFSRVLFSLEKSIKKKLCTLLKRFCKSVWFLQKKSYRFAKVQILGNHYFPG